MTYIWFNPVVIAMYGWKQLECLAHNNHFQPIQCKEDWGSYVKNRYKQELAVSTKTILDLRCPKAVDYVKKYFPVEEYTFPDIEPILVHCAREVHKCLAKDDKLLIITPCIELAVCGNNLMLKNTTFLTFSHLLEKTNTKLDSKTLLESPIPPGFFSEVSKECMTLTGQEEIHEFFSKSQKTNHKIIELLYCPQGCHKGPGVR